jgi:hypothetical protein
VRAADRIPVAPVALLRHPDGSPKLEVRFLAPDGTVQGREHRTSAALTWLSSFGPDLPISKVAALEVHTRVRVPDSGTYLLDASALPARERRRLRWGDIAMVAFQLNLAQQISEEQELERTVSPASQPDRRGRGGGRD